VLHNCTELTFSAFCNALHVDLFMAVHSHCLCTFCDPVLLSIVVETSLG
jgi:hypothetical protein